MFKFININKKNSVVPGASMTAEKYMALVEKDVLPHLTDEKLLQTLGVKTLFNRNARISKKLTYDEACDCLARFADIVDVTMNICHIVGARSTAISQKRTEDLSADEREELRLNLGFHSFYSVDNINSMIDVAKSIESDKAIEKPNNLEEAMEKLHGCFGLIIDFKNIMFTNIHMSAMLEELS